VVGATLPPQFISIYAVNAATGEIAAPAALVRPDYSFEISSLATQPVRLYYVASNTAGEVQYPQTVNAVQGQTVTGITLTVPPS
jgi:hypothetical protein